MTHLSNVPLLPLAAAMISRCHVETLRAYLFVSFDHTLAFYVGLLQTKPGQEPFCTKNGPILFYSSMWMIFINEALFTVCFLRVLRVLVTVFALGLLKQLSLCSVLRPRKGGETWTLSPGLGLPRGLDQTFCILNKEGFLCSTICDVCGLWFIDNKSLCSGPQLLLQNTG